MKFRHMLRTVESAPDLRAVQATVLELAARIRRSCEPQRERAVDYIARYSGGKNRLLEQARVSLQSSAFRAKDSRVSMFLKDDKYFLDDLKEPRCIQYRSKRFHLYLGRFIHPMEVLFCHYEDNGIRICAKSRNSLDRASDLRAAWEEFVDPMAVLLDHSKFDAHVAVPHLDVEHSFYKALNPDLRLAHALSMQMHNVGYTKHGTRYEVDGTRMSGDVTTGFGNSVINYAMIATWLKKCGVRGRAYVDGDDSVVTMSRDQYDKLDFSWWVSVGMHTKVEHAYEFEHVEFCQCRPVWIDQVGEWRMVRNPTRVVSRAPWTTRNYPEVALLRLVRTIGWCELASNGGVPILQSYASWFMEQGSGRLMRNEIEAHLRDRVEHVSCSVPNIATRLSFESAWGISVAEQFLIERTLAFDRLL